MKDKQLLLQLDGYFQSVIDKIPAEVYCSASVDTKRNVNGLKHKISNNARKANAKRQKMNPKYMKAINDVAMDNSSSDEENDRPMKRKKTKSILNVNSNTTIEELQQKLRKKISCIQIERQGNKSNVKKKTMLNKKDKQNSKKHSKFVKVIEPSLSKSKLENDIGNSVSEKITTNEGKIVFSKFDFAQMVKSTNNNQVNKKYNLPIGKDYKTLLSKVEKENEKLEQLKQDDPKKASDFIEKKAWSKAAAKAEGLKLKDDPTLLKKSLKRKLSMKQQSAKRWKERNDEVQEKMKKKQDKRTTNIRKKKEFKKDRKAFKRGTKKRVPGF